MKKIIILFIALFMMLSVEAKTIKNDFTSVIKDFDVDIESIAVSIKNADNGKVVYSINDKV